MGAPRGTGDAASPAAVAAAAEVAGGSPLLEWVTRHAEVEPWALKLIGVAGVALRWQDSHPDQEELEWLEAEASQVEDWAAT